ncbi:MAG: DUF916 and DUF3324 domain-containing protein [Oscillospiraceae bacterium]|nr:DUF916 and DUF3324 domain-containing protein [Oscillospiraceae bacterium]
MYTTRRIIKIIGTLIIIAAMALPVTVICAASSSVGFSITPVLPENQQQNDSSFFDLLVYPGQEQNLVVMVHNESSESITVLVEAVTASTNRNGDIDYTSKSAVMDETLQTPLEEMITIPQTHYTIPADSSIPVSVKLNVPERPFDGIALGSIRVLKEVTEEERAAGGMIVNQFAYVVAVRLAQSRNAGNIEPDFALGDVTAELVNHRASIVAQIRNPKPVLISGTSITSVIYPKGSNQPVFRYDMPDVSFAPNSIFNLSFVDRAGYGIEAGEYTAKVSVEFQGETWDFEQDFIVTAQEAAVVNENAVNQQAQQSPRTPGVAGGIPQWVIYTGATVLAIMFIGLLVLTVVVIKRNLKPINIEELVER